MNPIISSVDDFDQALLAEYARFVDNMPGQPASDLQKRFVQYGIFPKLGWALIGTGEAQALAANAPAILYGTIARFIKWHTSQRDVQLVGMPVDIVTVAIIACKGMRHFKGKRLGDPYYLVRFHLLFSL